MASHAPPPFPSLTGAQPPELPPIQVPLPPHIRPAAGPPQVAQTMLVEYQMRRPQLTPGEFANEKGIPVELMVEWLRAAGIQLFLPVEKRLQLIEEFRSRAPLSQSVFCAEKGLDEVFFASWVEDFSKAGAVQGGPEWMRTLQQVVALDQAGLDGFPHPHAHHHHPHHPHPAAYHDMPPFGYPPPPPLPPPQSQHHPATMHPGMGMGAMVRVRYPMQPPPRAYAGPHAPQAPDFGPSYGYEPYPSPYPLRPPHPAAAIPPFPPMRVRLPQAAPRPMPPDGASAAADAGEDVTDRYDIIWGDLRVEGCEGLEFAVMAGEGAQLLLEATKGVRTDLPLLQEYAQKLLSARHDEIHSDRPSIPPIAQAHPFPAPSPVTTETSVELDTSSGVNRELPGGLEFTVTVRVVKRGEGEGAGASAVERFPFLVGSERGVCIAWKAAKDFAQRCRMAATGASFPLTSPFMNPPWSASHNPGVTVEELITAGLGERGIAYAVTDEAVTATLPGASREGNTHQFVWRRHHQRFEVKGGASSLSLRPYFLSEPCITACLDQAIRFTQRKRVRPPDHPAWPPTLPPALSDDHGGRLAKKQRQMAPQGGLVFLRSGRELPPGPGALLTDTESKGALVCLLSKLRRFVRQHVHPEKEGGADVAADIPHVLAAAECAREEEIMAVALPPVEQQVRGLRGFKLNFDAFLLKGAVTLEECLTMLQAFFCGDRALWWPNSGQAPIAKTHRRSRKTLTAEQIDEDLQQWIAFIGTRQPLTVQQWEAFRATVMEEAGQRAAADAQAFFAGVSEGQFGSPEDLNDAAHTLLYEKVRSHPTFRLFQTREFTPKVTDPCVIDLSADPLPTHPPPPGPQDLSRWMEQSFWAVLPDAALDAAAGDDEQAAAPARSKPSAKGQRRADVTHRLMEGMGLDGGDGAGDGGSSGVVAADCVRVEWQSDAKAFRLSMGETGTSRTFPAANETDAAVTAAFSGAMQHIEDTRKKDTSTSVTHAPLPPSLPTPQDPDREANALLAELARTDPNHSITWTGNGFRLVLDCKSAKETAGGIRGSVEREFPYLGAGRAGIMAALEQAKHYREEEMVSMEEKQLAIKDQGKGSSSRDGTQGGAGAGGGGDGARVYRIPLRWCPHSRAYYTFYDYVRGRGRQFPLLFRVEGPCGAGAVKIALRAAVTYLTQQKRSKKENDVKYAPVKNPQHRRQEHVLPLFLADGQKAALCDAPPPKKDWRAVLAAKMAAAAIAGDTDAAAAAGGGGSDDPKDAGAGVKRMGGWEEAVERERR